MEIKKSIQSGLINVIKKENINKPRDYLGVSMAGYSCNRKIWMNFRFIGHSSLSDKSIKILARGHAFEEELINRFKKIIDINVLSTQDGFDDEWISGHCDAILEYEKEKYILEVKTANQNRFLKIEREGIIKSNPEYYVQIQLYMHYFKVNKGLFFVVNKNTEDYYMESFEYDKDFAIAQIEKLKYIISCDTPPEKINNNPDFFECKMCDLYSICHENKPINYTCRSCVNFELGNNRNSYCKGFKKPISFKAVSTVQTFERSCPKYEIIEGITKNSEDVEKLKKALEERFGKVKLMLRNNEK